MLNYFELLGLPVTYALDENALRTAYFAAQRQWHPDRFVGKPETERAEAILKSQTVNEAYEALKNPLTRAEHLLEIHGVFVNSEEGGEAVAPALLMEMMELREQLADAAGEGRALAAVTDEIKKAATDCQARLTTLCEAGNWNEAAQETVRFSYLMKALEEAHMYIYRLKAGAGNR